MLHVNNKYALVMQKSFTCTLFFLLLTCCPWQIKAQTITSYPADDGTFQYIWAIAADTAGNVYFTDNNNNRLRKMNPAGIVTTLTGGTGWFSLNGPTGIAIDQAGNLYYCGSHNQRSSNVIPQGP